MASRGVDGPGFAGRAGRQIGPVTGSDRIEGALADSLERPLEIFDRRGGRGGVVQAAKEYAVGQYYEGRRVGRGRREAAREALRATFERFETRSKYGGRGC